ncbi:AAA family ATPase, partial [bacterium]|nr:AAA family ATPase [bacterium]
ARKTAPCILFIDEVDAVGTRRADSPSGGDREHAQTLNALLACIDGFTNDPQAPPVVLIAATNRPEMLDDAFVRPGRFDRQVSVGLPGPEARREMLAVHTKAVVLFPNLDLGHIAELASGMSGAQIANVVNEAARAATRRKAAAIEELDFREAFDVIQIGGKMTDRIPSPGERHRTAVHESGHAILAWVGNIPVRRVTILPRGRALGANILGGQDTPPCMADEVRARVAMLLAGYAAEELVLGKPSLGAAQDLVEADRLLTALISSGFSETYPLVAMRESETRAWNALMVERSKTLDAILVHAKSILTSNRPLLDELTETLLRKETILRDELDRLLSSVRRETPSV